MADQEILNELIAVYRDLNMRLRGADLDAIKEKKADNGETVLEILRRMRNREYNASLAVKQMSMDGDSSAIDESSNAEVLDELILTEMTPKILLSQFGTAREATLSLLRNIGEEEWDKEHPTPRGNMTMREYLRAVVNDDREDEKLLNQLVETAAA